MTKRDITILSCKIAGIFILTTSLMMLIGNLAFIFSIANHLRVIYQAGLDNQQAQISILELLSNGGSALIQLLLLGLGIWLWLDGGRFSAWIVPDHGSKLPVVISCDFARIIISLMGVVILMVALPGLFTNLYIYASTTSGLTLFPAGMLSATINSVIGFWLFCCAKNIYPLHNQQRTNINIV